LQFARRPVPEAGAARANYNSSVLCSKSLSNAGEDEAGEVFSRRRFVSRGVFSWDQVNTGGRTPIRRYANRDFINEDKDQL